MSDSDIKYIPREDSAADGDTNVGAAQSITIGTISALTLTTSLGDEDLFEVSAKMDATKGKFLSKAVSWKTIFSKLQDISFTHNENTYIASRDGSLKQYIIGLKENEHADVLQFLTSNDKIPSGEITAFTGTPAVWGDVYALSIWSLKHEGEIADLQDDLDELLNTRIAFSAGSQFEAYWTTWGNSLGGSKTTKDPPTKVSSSLSNAYENYATSGQGSGGFLLAFDTGKKESTTYTCTTEGMLCIYGWVDSTTIPNRAYLPEAWCALQALNETDKTWEIIAIQPVIPNKQLSYVGFTVPVMKDLRVRVQLGFTPGNASGRYPHSDLPASLSNTTPNAFLGGIYTTSGLTSTSNDDLENAGVSKLSIEPKTVINATYNNAIQEIDTEKFVTKEELSEIVPEDFYTRKLTYNREQVNKAFSYHIAKADVVPEVCVENKNGEFYGNDDKPVNRLAVWNALCAGETPVGTIIENITAPTTATKGSKQRTLPGRPEWVYCGGVGKINDIKIPDFSSRDSSTGTYHYIKTMSSYEACKTAGWSKAVLKSQGVDVSSKLPHTWMTDKAIQA